MQWFLFAGSVAFFLVTLLFLPETVHPGTSGYEKAQAQNKPRIPILNPLASLALVRSPLILCIVRPTCSVAWCDPDTTLGYHRLFQLNR